MRVKYIKVNSIQSKYASLDNYPNFSAGGSIKGMKKLFYGKDALLVRSGSYIYNVTSKPYIYHNLAH